MINERMLKGSAPHEDCRGKAKCSLLQKENFRKLIDGKNATRFPFWRERIKAANFVCCRCESEDSQVSESGVVIFRSV